MLRRVPWRVLTAAVLAYLAIAAWGGVSGVGLALLANLLAALYANALRKA